MAQRQRRMRACGRGGVVDGSTGRRRQLRVVVAFAALLVMLVHTAAAATNYTWCDNGANKCATEMLGDGVCDAHCLGVFSCDVEDGEDGGDCGLSTDGCGDPFDPCPLSLLGNGVCDAACNIAECNWDLNDCETCDVAGLCYIHMVGDGTCDPECMSDACTRDADDCAPTCDPSGQCVVEIVDDGVCDTKCLVYECGYDGGTDCDVTDACTSDVCQAGVCIDIGYQPSELPTQTPSPGPADSFVCDCEGTGFNGEFCEHANVCPASDGYLDNLGEVCWYRAPVLGMSCRQVCASHGGFDAVGSQHSGTYVADYFFPAVFSTIAFPHPIECHYMRGEFADLNVAADGTVPDPDWYDVDCYALCGCAMPLECNGVVCAWNRVCAEPTTYTEGAECVPCTNSEDSNTHLPPCNGVAVSTTSIATTTTATMTSGSTTGASTTGGSVTSTASSDGDPVASGNTGVVGAVVVVGMALVCTLCVGMAVLYRRQRRVLKMDAMAAMESREMGGVANGKKAGMDPDGSVATPAQSTEPLIGARASQSTRASLSTVYLEDVERQYPIGKGAFGTVFAGLWMGSTPVALKQFRGQRSALVQEATILQGCLHPNIVQFLGIYDDHTGSVAASGTHDVYMVMELLADGSLLDLLRSTDGAKLSVADLLSIAMHGCSGCQYLHARGIVHRDIAGRNLLVERRGGRYVVKVSDFGLSVLVADGRAGGVDVDTFPIRWTAPEAMHDGVYSAASDVWSFGVVLFEIFSHGAKPYDGVRNAEVIAAVRSGERLYRPDMCPPTVYDLMLRCWSASPAQRPSMKEVSQCLRREIDGLSRLSTASSTTTNGGTRQRGDTVWRVDELPAGRYHSTQQQQQRQQQSSTYAAAAAYNDAAGVDDAADRYNVNRSLLADHQLTAAANGVTDAAAAASVYESAVDDGSSEYYTSPTGKDTL